MLVVQLVPLITVNTFEHLITRGTD